MTLQTLAHQEPQASGTMTPLQEGMLYDHLTASIPGLDVQQIVIRFRESIDAEQMGSVWNGVAARHDALRTRVFISTTGAAVAETMAAEQHEFTVIDLAELSVGDAESTIQAYLATDRQRGFALDQAPLSRVALFRMGPTHHVLIWTFHHLILDGRSHARFLQEVFQVYESQGQGAFSDPPATIHSPDLATTATNANPQVAEQYWRARLAPLTCPTRFPQAGIGLGLASQLAGHDSVSCVISPIVDERLELLLSDTGLTKNSVLQSLWGWLLSYYTGEGCVAFGSIRAGRPRSKSDSDRLGMFICHVPTVVKVSETQSFLELVRSVRTQHLEVREFDQVPLAKVQSWSGQSSNSPLYDSLVMYDHHDLSGYLCSVDAKWQQREIQLLEQSRIPVTLLASGAPEFRLSLRYDRKRFDRRLMSQILAHLEHALSEFTLDPTRSLASVSCVTAAEQTQILHEFNQTSTDYSSDTDVVSMFIDQVNRTPHGVAVVDDRQQWDYQQLAERVNSVANGLSMSGVSSETVVGVMVDRSCEMMAAIWGVLRAGGAFLPLNPDDPPARLQFMLETANALTVITQPHLQEKLQPSKANILLVDDLLASSSAPPAVEIDPLHLAYVLFTSGSTGRPKGVMIEHRSIHNRLRWTQDAFELTAEDRVLQKTPTTFDVSVWELLWPLLTGARIVLAAPGRHRDPRYIVDTIASQGITVMHFVPSMLRHFLTEDGVEDCSSLRCVICSGEALTTDDVQRFRRRSRAALHNLYGPTEAAIDVSHWPCDQESSCNTVPIGFPIANTRLYVLDASLRLCPIGIPGELYIAGIQVARGYVGRPDLTSERFRNDHLIPCGESMYRTGDRAKLLPDGSIEYLGRCDSEVKLNGVRIDLQEIESALREHSDIDDAVVVLADAPGNQKRLIAYYTQQRESRQHAITDTVLRSALRELLPASMIPQVFVKLDSIPLGSAGKVARAMLPDPPTIDQKNFQPVIHRSELENKIAMIWAQTLGVPQVRSDENFFDIGGHSLMLLAVHQHVEQAIGYRFPIIKSLEHTTVGGLANFLENTADSNPRIARAKSRGSLRREHLRKQRDKT